MSYHDGLESVELLLEGRFDKAAPANCDPKAGWKRSGNKCIRVKKKQRKSNIGLKVGLGTAGAAAGIAAGVALAAGASRNTKAQAEEASWKEFEKRNFSYGSRRSNSTEYKPGDDPFEYVSRKQGEYEVNREKFREDLEKLRQRMREEQARRNKQTGEEESTRQQERAKESTKQTSSATGGTGKGKTFQEELGLGKDASSKEVRRKYLELAKQYHPDVSKDPGAEKKMKDLNEKYNKWKESTSKRDSYLKGVAFVDSAIAQRVDAITRKRPSKLKCRPGFKQQGAVCKPIRQGESPELAAGRGFGAAQGGSPLSRSGRRSRVRRSGGKGKGGTLVAGATTAAIAGAAVALPLMELEQIGGKNREGGVKIPPEGLSPERLENYNKQFKKGDIVRHKFILPTGTPGYHYGVYVGPDEKTGEPQMIHINPVMEGGKRKGVGVVVTGMKPRQSGAYEYEKDPDQPSRRIDIDKKLKEIAPYIGKTIDFNIMDKNCEAFARGLVGQKMESTAQTAKMSKVGRTIGRNLFGKPISLIASKGKRSEITFKDIESALNKEVNKVRTRGIPRRDADIPEESPSGIDWKAFLEEDGEGGYQIIQPETALEIANSYNDSAKRFKIAYLKGYFLFLAAARYVQEGGSENAET